MILLIILIDFNLIFNLKNKKFNIMNFFLIERNKN